jgi:hypothetical protein
MTEIEAIITIARRYCIENATFWWRIQEQEKGKKIDSNNIYNLFPRYTILWEILKEVETLINKKYRILSQCRNELLLAEKKCDAIINKWLDNEIALTAANDERSKFINFINNISDANLNDVLPLPYNRKLTQKESKSVLRKLNEVWAFDGGYWNPLENKCRLETIFLMENNFTDTDKEKIIDYLKKKDKRFYTLDENNYDYETEEIEINGCETVYTNKKFEWIIYISHERTIAFGGVSLINFIKDIFSERKEKINNW